MYVSQAVADTPQQLIGEEGRYRVRCHDLSYTNLQLSPGLPQQHCRHFYLSYDDGIMMDRSLTCSLSRLELWV
jgi:hypothetical protein